MKDIEVTLEGFGQTWKPGEFLIDLEVTLGQNEKSSNCMVYLSDPLGLIAAALVNHTVALGGIQQLPSSNPNITPTTPVASQVSASGDGSAGVVASGEKFTPQVKAFLDMVAVREVGGYHNYQISRDWYFTAINDARFTEAEAMRPKPPYERFTSTKAAGRYQIIPKTWEFIKSRNPGQFTNFLPESQDRAAYYLLSYRGMIPYINAGDIKTAIAKGRNEWTSLPGAAEQQAGWTLEKALEYYQQRLRFYQGGTQVAQAAPKVEPTTPKVTPNSPQPTQEPVKGNKITVNWANVSFEFFHQGTSWDDSGVTKVYGQGIRWVLNRRKRNKAVKNTTLKTLAAQIAAAHKLKLDWQSTYDPEYEHIDQSGITDYQLLVREATFAGLYVSEDGKGTLTVKSRDKITDSGFFIEPKVNLIKYTIEDKALDNTQEESGLLQDETKATVEPTTGQLKPLAPDVDTVKAQDTTGKQTQAIAGKPKPGQDAIMATNRAKMKRIKGLPSTFVVTLEPARTLQLKPLDAVRTKGLPDPFNRIWMVDKVTHRASNQTTTLEVYSPVEVIDNTPAATTQPQQPSAEPMSTPGKWIYPASGTVTSGYGLRNTGIAGASRDHKGIDIANSTGTPVLAAGDGLVITARNGYNGGAGNYIAIRHDDGSTTRYFHNNVLRVTEGQKVRKGQQIADMGSTGVGSGSHLHFEYFPPGVNITRGNQINPSRIWTKLGTKGASILGGSPVE